MMEVAVNMAQGVEVARTPDAKIIDRKQKVPIESPNGK